MRLQTHDPANDILLDGRGDMDCSLTRVPSLRHQGRDSADFSSSLLAICAAGIGRLIHLSTLVDLPNVNVKHLSQKRLFRERITYEIKAHSGAEGTPRTQEMVFGIGLQDQFRHFHGTHNVTRVIRGTSLRRRLINSAKRPRTGAFQLAPSSQAIFGLTEVPRGFAQFRRWLLRLSWEVHYCAP